MCGRFAQAQTREEYLAYRTNSVWDSGRSTLATSRSG